MSEAKEEVLLEIPLADGGGTLRFKSLDEIEAWLNDEQAAFQFLKQTAAQEGTISVLWNRIAQFVGHVQTRLAQVRVAARSSPPTSSSLLPIVEFASEFYAWSGLGGASPRRAFVLETREA